MEELKVLRLEWKNLKWKYQIQNKRVESTRFRMEELEVLDLEWKS